MTAQDLAIPTARSNRPIATYGMAASAVLLLISLFLPYVVSTTSTDLSVSVIGVLTKSDVSFVPSDAMAVYTGIAGVVIVTALIGLLGLTGRKLFGVLSALLALAAGGFQFLMIMIANDGSRSTVEIGTAAWVIVIGCAILFISSIVFLFTKKRI